MKRVTLFITAAFLLQACASGVWDAAATGMCIAADAGCMKDCYRDEDGRYIGGYGAKACEASCSSGCAFSN